MKLDFTKNFRRNAVASMVNNSVKQLLPFLNRTLFLWLLGPAFLGLNGLFGSILGMLTLSELGFGKAIATFLYKPIAEDDRDLVCAYLNFYRTVYRRVGAFILCAGLCLLPFLRRLVHGNIPPGISLHLLFLLHLGNTAVSYFFFAYRGIILGAYNRNDVHAYIDTIVSFAKYIAVFLVLLLTRNYYLYVVTTVVFTVIVNLLIFWKSRQLFPDIEPCGQLSPALRHKVLVEVKSIFMHKVGGIIAYQADNLIISAFLGLTAVAIYGNYYYVVTAVSGLVGVLFTGLPSGFGNKIHTESPQQNFKLFMRVGHLTQIAIVWCAAIMLALYQPFINVWTKGCLARHTLTPVLMVLFFYITMSRSVLQTFKQAAGLWHQDRWKPIVSGLANLALNITFVILLPPEYRLDGVIASTILAFVLIELPWESHVLFTHYFDRQQHRWFWGFHARCAIFAVLVCAATWGAVTGIPAGGIPVLLLKGGIAPAVATALVLLFCRDDARKLLVKMATGRETPNPP